MKTLQLSDFKNYKFMSRLRFSPGGGRSALIVAQANGENGYTRVLWVQDPARGMLRMAETGSDALFFWEDDDTLIFSAARSASAKKAKEKGEPLTCFYRIRVSGGEAVEAFSWPLAIKDVEPLGNGRYLAVAEYDSRFPGLSSLIAAEREEALTRRKAEKDYLFIDELPYWSNGQGYINGLRTRLFLLTEKNQAFLPLTGPDEDISGLRLSPDRNYAAYTVKDVQPDFSQRDILYETNLRTLEIKKLLDSKYDIGKFDYYGDFILFTGTQGEQFGINQNHDFYTVPRSGGEETLLYTYDYTVGAPVGTDSRLGGGKTFVVKDDAVYFVSTQGYFCSLYRLDLTALQLERLSPDAGSFDFFDVAGSSIQAVAFLDQQLQELYDLSEGNCRSLSSFNEAFLREHPPVVPQHHTFTDTDGWEIDGWVMLPPDYDPDKKLPALVNIHGGPKSLFGSIYFHEMQFLVQSGYVVLFCNPRGSDGQGNLFADVRGSYGTFDYGDIMQFTDEMLNLYPGIDSDRLGVMGGSYGGFMVNWIVGHTDKFRAAVSQRSICNWISFTCTSDIGPYFGPDQMGADVWGNHEKMWDASPLKYAPQVKTPTLFMHSDEDYRCWIAEGYQMYTALKMHGVPTRLCVFHGENHELSRSGKPEHRETRLKELSGWMDFYLKGQI